MFAAARLAILQQRKRELLDALEGQRRLITLECAATRQRLAWVERIASIANQVSPFLGAAAPLLGVWLARRGSGQGSWLGRLVNALPVAERLAGAVRQLLQH